MRKANHNLKRIAFNLPINLIERIKQYSINQGLTVTSSVIVLLNKALDEELKK